MLRMPSSIRIPPSIYSRVNWVVWKCLEHLYSVNRIMIEPGLFLFAAQLSAKLGPVSAHYLQNANKHSSGEHLLYATSVLLWLLLLLWFRLTRFFIAAFYASYGLRRILLFLLVLLNFFLIFLEILGQWCI